jgi:hypothetical protein
MIAILLLSVMKGEAAFAMWHEACPPYHILVGHCHHMAQQPAMGICRGILFAEVYRMRRSYCTLLQGHD